MAHLEKGERRQAVILLRGQRHHRARVISQTLHLLDRAFPVLRKQKMKPCA